jgi:hypothetical protein
MSMIEKVGQVNVEFGRFMSAVDELFEERKKHLDSFVSSAKKQHDENDAEIAALLDQIKNGILEQIENGSELFKLPENLFPTGNK